VALPPGTRMERQAMAAVAASRRGRPRLRALLAPAASPAAPHAMPGGDGASETVSGKDDGAGLAAAPAGAMLPFRAAVAQGFPPVPPATAVTA
jgi:hypothetical protein